MHPLGTKVYLLKRYSPSDSFWTFFSESETSTNECEILCSYFWLYAVVHNHW